VLRVGSLVQSAGLETALLGASTTQSSASVTTAELQKTFGAVTTVTTIGLLQETDAVLGMQGSGALGIAGTAQTSFLTLAGSRALGSATTLSAMVSGGHHGRVPEHRGVLDRWRNGSTVDGLEPGSGARQRASTG